MQSQKWQNDLCFQGKPFNIMEIQAYAPTSNTEEAEDEWFYEDLQDILELAPPKWCPFKYRGLECKSRKSRNTWSNRQIWPWSTEWSRAKANWVLPRECTGHSKHPFQQPKRWLYTWASLDDQYRNQIDYGFLQLKMELYTVSKNKTWSWLCLRSSARYCKIQAYIEESRANY